MIPLSEVRAEAARLRALFEAEGAQTVDCAILQDAETLLDLYGEDIRARAFVTTDPVRGEVMLRPDFTVPVVQMHMSDGAEPARYTYAGEVFRRQEIHPDRPAEYLQVGFEIFDRSAPEQADADVFAAFHRILRDLPLRAVTGDIGVLRAAVEGLRTSDRRRAALLRHLWRPRRFRALLDRFSGKTPVPETRKALLASDNPFKGLSGHVGLRSRREIAERIEALRADAAEPPISREEVACIDSLLSVRENIPNAVARLADIAVDLPAIDRVLPRLDRRAEALAARGIAIETVDFEGSYGRTSLEYYDGFVFGFTASALEDIPPVATGGRYDALTRQLGRGRSIPAVGGVIRPDLLLRMTRGGKG